jgi:beta-galactosidase/beta-glucuronidase
MAGLYRNAWLNRANPDIRIEDLFVYSNQIQVESNHQKALWATLHANMTLVNNNYEPKGGDLCVDISISNEDGERATPTLTNRHSISSVSHGTDQSFSYHVKLLFPQLWSTAHPYLYKVEASLRMCDTGQTFDSISTYHGIRSIQYTSDHGFLLNQEAFKIRGFCDHNTFGVVGKILWISCACNST